MAATNLATELSAHDPLVSGREHEHRRLQLLEHIFDPHTIPRISARGIPEAARCLELGGGGGSIARWLCHEVGPRGYVTATDLDTTLLEELDQPNLTVIRHDLAKDQFPHQTFDLIHARALLEHVADREEVLERVRDWLAPGGWLHVEAFAFFPVDSATDSAYREALLALESLRGQTGSDYRWPRTFPEPLLRIGLIHTHVDVHIEAVRGGTPLAELLRLTLEHLRTPMLDAALITETQLDAATRTLRDPSFHELAPAHVAASGQLPLRRCL